MLCEYYVEEIVTEMRVLIEKTIHQRINAEHFQTGKFVTLKSVTKT